MMKRFILLWIVCFSLVGTTALACSGFVVQDGERVLVGNNEDWFNPPSKIWFMQPVNGRYGSVFFGFDNFWPQGGMSQKGLFFDDDPRFVVRYPEVYETGKPLDSSQVFLAQCRYGKVPVLTVSVSTAGNDRALSRVGNEKMAIFPLEMASIEPDIVLIYGTPAQMARLAAGYLYHHGELIESKTTGFGISCLSAVKSHFTGKPALVLPGRGEEYWRARTTVKCF